MDDYARILIKLIRFVEFVGGGPTIDHDGPIIDHDGPADHVGDICDQQNDGIAQAGQTLFAVVVRNSDVDDAFALDGGQVMTKTMLLEDSVAAEKAAQPWRQSKAQWRNSLKGKGKV